MGDVIISPGDTTKCVNNLDRQFFSTVRGKGMSRLDPTLHPQLTQNVIDRLFKRKFYTVLSFVDCDPEVIAKISGLQYSTVLTVRNAILTKFSSPLLTGDKLYNEMIENCAIIRTGIRNLDELLDGGFVTGNIYELCGKTGSGKSQICITTSVNVSVTYPNQTVLYVDTKNDLSSDRIFEIIEKCRNTIDLGSTMNRIKICRINRASQLLSLLEKLIRDSRSSETKTPGFRLLVIDSISPIFFRFLGDETNRGFVLLNHLSNLLHFLSVECQIAVLVANLVTDWTVETDSGEFDSTETVSREIETPVLGKYWTHVPETRINVKKMEDSEMRLLVLMKSTNQRVGKAAHVVVTDAGVQ